MPSVAGADTQGKQRNLWKIVVPALAVVALIAAGVYYRLHGAQRLTEKDTIVVADFSNSTGDPVFDDTLKTALTVALNESPFLNVLPENKITSTLKLMTRPADTKLTPEVARELCERSGSKAYFAGSIATLGNQYVLELKAVNCPTGDPLAEEQVTAEGKEKVLNAVGTAAAKLRGEMGESLASVQKFDVPLQEATTSSLEALKAYTLGIKARNEKGPEACLLYHQRAIQLDPNFAMGYRALGGAYSSLGQIARASEYLTKAFELRDHAGERERLIITAEFYSYVTGELDKAAKTCEALIDSYPRYADAYNRLGTIYSLEGQFDKAIEMAQQCQRLAPERIASFGNLAAYLIASNRFSEARQEIEEAHVRKLEHYIVHTDLYLLSFLAGNQSGMEEEQQWFAARPDVADNGSSLASDTEAYGGHLSKARDLTRRSVNEAVQADNKENAAIWWENAALREAGFDNLAEARADAATGLKLAPASQGASVEAALTYAMTGDSARAQSLAQDLNKRYPLNTQTQSLWLPTIRAQLSLNRKDADGAIDQLRSALPPIEYASLPFVNNVSCMYYTYIRGQAYLAAGKGTEAATEFQKILDHSGIVWNCWTGALAHVGVARANALQARISQGAVADAARVRALAAYKNFFAVWKDADPEIPILKEARAEYAKLQ